MVRANRSAWPTSAKTLRVNQLLPSEHESGHNCAIARQLNRGDRARITEARIDPTKTRCRLTLRISLLCGQGVRERRILEPSTVEDIAEFGADIQGYTLLYAERSADS